MGTFFIYPHRAYEPAEAPNRALSRAKKIKQERNDDSMAYDGSISIDTKVDVSSIQSSLTKLESSMKKSVQELDKISQGIQDVVDNLKPLQETQFSGIIGNLNDVTGLIGNLKGGISGLSEVTGASVTQLGGWSALIAATLAVMGGGLYGYLNYMYQFSDETNNLISSTGLLLQSTEQFNKTVQSNQKYRKESLLDSEAEAEVTRKFADELFNLNDKQEKSIEDREKMQTLVDQLNKSIPELNMKYNKETGALEANREEVYKAVEAKVALAKQNAAMELMTEAYKDQYKAEAEMNSLLKQRYEINEKIKYLESNPNIDTSSGPAYNELRVLKDELKNVDAALVQTKDTYLSTANEADYALGLMTQSTTNMSSNTKLSTDEIKSAFSETYANVGNDTKKMREELTLFGYNMMTDSSKYGEDFIRAWQTSVETADDSALESIDSFMELVLQNMDKKDDLSNIGDLNTGSYTEAMKKRLSEADLQFEPKIEQETQKAANAADKGGKNVVDKFENSAVYNRAPDFTSPILKSIFDAKTAVGNEAPAVSQTYGEAVENGVNEKKPSLLNLMKGVMTDINSAGQTEAEKSETQVGAPFAQGTANGIKNNSYLAVNAAIAMVQDSITAAKNAGVIQSPSKVTRDEIGKPLVQGLVKGIGLEQKNLNKSMGGLLNNMLKSGKNTMGIHSPSTVMRDEVGKMLVYGIRDGIDKNSEAAVEEFQTLLKKLKSQRDLDIINEDEYYTELEKLRDAYFKEGTEEWVQYTTEIYNYQQKLQEEQKKTIIDTYQTMVDEADKAISELEKKQENFEKKLQQNDYFFVTRTLKDAEGNEVDKFGELRDFSDEIEKINQYNDAIDKAQARLGGSAQGQAVYEALLDMDMEQGKLFADTLINASDAELQEYLKSYQEYQNAIKQASKEEFADEWAELESQYGGMYQRLEQTIIDTFGEIPEEFLENGKLSAEQFGDGFLEKLTEVQSKLDSGAMGIKLADETALQQQRSDGQAAGEAFSQGLVQSEQAIQTAGSSLKDKLIEQFGSVPDDFFAIGQDSANSFCEGFMEKLQSAFAAIQNAVTAGMQSMAPSLALAGGFAAGSVSTYHNNYNFYGSGQDSTVSIFKCQ